MLGPGPLDRIPSSYIFYYLRCSHHPDSRKFWTRPPVEQDIGQLPLPFFISLTFEDESGRFLFDLASSNLVFRPISVSDTSTLVPSVGRSWERNNKPDSYQSSVGWRAHIRPFHRGGRKGDIGDHLVDPLHGKVLNPSITASSAPRRRGALLTTSLTFRWREPLIPRMNLMGLIFWSLRTPITVILPLSLV